MAVCPAGTVISHYGRYTPVMDVYVEPMPLAEGEVPLTGPGTA